MLNVNELIGFGAGGSGSDVTFVLTSTWSRFPGGGLQSCTVRLPIGAAAPDRKIVVVAQSNDGVLHPLYTPVTLDGVAMTYLGGQNGQRGNTVISIINWPTNNVNPATGLVDNKATIYWSSSDTDIDGQSVAVYAVYGAKTLLPDWSQLSYANNAAITVPEGGVAVLAISWAWQATAGGFGTAPMIADYTNLYSQGFLSGGHGYPTTPITIQPGVSTVYNGGLYVAAWK